MYKSAYIAYEKLLHKIQQSFIVQAAQKTCTKTHSFLAPPLSPLSAVTSVSGSILFHSASWLMALKHLN